MSGTRGAVVTKRIANTDHRVLQRERQWVVGPRDAAGYDPIQEKARTAG